MDINTTPPSVEPMQNTNFTPIADPVPGPAKAIAIFFYCLTVAFIIVGILLCMSSTHAAILMRIFDTGFGVMSGMFAILWGVICFFVGFGIWTGTQWGRVLAIGISLLYMLLGVVSFFKLGSTNYIAVLISVIIASYLLLSVDVQSSYEGPVVDLLTISLVIVTCIIFVGMEYSLFTHDSVVITTNQNSIASARTQNTVSTIHVYSNAKYNFRLAFREYYSLNTLNISGTSEYQFKNFSGRLLLTVAVSSANGQSLNTIIAKNYTVQGETIQRSNSFINGIATARLEILINNKATQVQYVLVHDGSLFVLFNQSATSTPVFVSVVNSLRFLR